MLTIRDLDDEVRDRLRIQAAKRGRSMEAEVRAILTEAVSPVESSLAAAFARFRDVTGGVELDSPARGDEFRDPFA